MKRFTFTFALLVLGTVAVSPYAQAQTPDTQEILMVQVIPELEQQLPSFKPESTQYKLQLTPSHTLSAVSNNDAQKYLNQGVERLEARDYKAAIENFTQALQVNPQIADAYLGRGIARHYLENYKEAITDFNQALQIDSNNPNNKYAYYFRGYSRGVQRDYQGAIAGFDKTIQLDSNLAGAYYYRGVANVDLGNKEKGIADLQIAAQLYKKQGKNDSAQEAIALMEKIRQA